MKNTDEPENIRNNGPEGNIPVQSKETKKSNLLLIAVCCCIIGIGIGILYVGPYFNLPFLSTCYADTVTMTYESFIPSTYDSSFLYQFGEPEPAAAPEMPLLLDYLPRRSDIDHILEGIPVNAAEGSVIGMYEFPGDSYLILINNGTSVTEVLGSGGVIRTYSLTPRTVGSRHTGAGERDYDRHSTYYSTTERILTIQRIDLILPGTANETCPLYIVNKTMDDTFFSREGAEAFSVSTTGTFSVIYGKRVERVAYSSTISHAPGWTICWQRRGTTMNGPNGELRHTVKLARSSERVQLSYFTVTGPYIQVAENMGTTSMNEWNSRDTLGCGC